MVGPDLAPPGSVRYCLRGPGMQASPPGSVVWDLCMKPATTATRTLRIALVLAAPLAAALPSVGFSTAFKSSDAARLDDTLLASAPTRPADQLWIRIRQPVGLSELARQLRLTPRTLAQLNDVPEQHRFRQGEWLVLPGQQSAAARQIAALDASDLRRSQPPPQTPPPVQTSGVVRLGDTLLKIAQRYGTTMQEILRMNPGLDTARLVAGTEIKLVQAAPLRPRTVLAVRPSSSGGLSWPDQPRFREEGSPADPGGTASWIWPAKGVFTSGYGWRWGRMHRGIDVANNVGTPIVAARTGRVVFSGWHDGGYGYLVTLAHADGSRSLYAHNSRLMVSNGQEVRQGAVIALMGSTGRSTGPHLHFEIHVPGTGAANPLSFLSPRA